MRYAPARGGSRITVTRQTAYVLDTVAVAASLVPNRQPGASAVLEVTVTAAGTVTLTGTDPDGAALTRSLVFSAAGTQETTPYRFATLTTVACTQTSGTVAVRALGLDGSEQRSTYTVVASRPATLDRDRASWPLPMPGGANTGGAIWIVPYEAAWSPRVGDLVAASDGSNWTVVGVEVDAPQQPGAWWLSVQRID